jgi:hypothetical protein
VTGEDKSMSAGAILLTFALVIIGVSAILALVFHLWPRYGSLEAVIEQSDRMLAEMEPPASSH